MQNKNYLAISDKNDLIFSSFCIKVNQYSLNEFQIKWTCNIPYNSVANEFVICRNYEDKSSQKVCVIPFIKGNAEYSFFDKISVSEKDFLSYSIYLKVIYDGTSIKSPISNSPLIHQSIPRLKKITLHIEAKKTIL